jgi:hypothetical protein
MYHRYDMDPIDVDPDGICENQTTAGAADLILNGALVDLNPDGTFDLYLAGYSDGIGGTRISIDSAGDIHTVTFTVYGTDQDGIERTEEITGVTTTAVNSVTYWKTITQIAADGAVGSNVFVGPVNEIITTSLPLNWRMDFPATITVTDLSGTVQFDIDETISVFDTDTNPDTLTWVTAQSNKTADLVGELARYSTGVRLVWDSYSSGAELQFTVRMQDYNS